MQTGGNAGYNASEKQQRLIHAGCWDYARHKFDETLKTARAQRKSGKGNVKVEPHAKHVLPDRKSTNCSL